MLQSARLRVSRHARLWLHGAAWMGKRMAAEAHMIHAGRRAVQDCAPLPERSAAPWRLAGVVAYLSPNHGGTSGSGARHFRIAALRLFLGRASPSTPRARYFRRFCHHRLPHHDKSWRAGGHRQGGGLAHHWRTSLAYGGGLGQADAIGAYSSALASTSLPSHPFTALPGKLLRPIWCPFRGWTLSGSIPRARISIWDSECFHRRQVGALAALGPVDALGGLRRLVT